MNFFFHDKDDIKRILTKQDPELLKTHRLVVKGELPKEKYEIYLIKRDEPKEEEEIDIEMTDEDWDQLDFYSGIY